MLLALVVTLIAIFAAIKLKDLDLYGDFHLELNDEVKNPSGTQWMNMGYWKDTVSFPKACESLALKTIQAARFVEDGHVLDVGHGSGDSLLLYLTHPDIPRPKTLSGITSSPIQHTQSTSRIALTETSIKTDIHLGDAIYRPNITTAHPLDPTSPAPLYTSITAIDCAYHFNSRYLFLSQSYERLAEGGYIALADMVVSSSPASVWIWLARMVISKALSVPSVNMITEEVLRAQLGEIGYVDVNMEDITLDVFPPLIQFLSGKGSRKLGRMWWVMGRMFEAWWKICGGRFLIVSARKPVM